MEHQKVHIIGAGIAGLTAAFYLKKKGVPFHLFEKNNFAGGRVYTENYKNFQLDIGFQVFLDGYDEPKKVLNLESLNLKAFAPGAKIIKGNKIHSIADPIRRPSMIFSSLFSKVGNLNDKIAILKLRLLLKNKSTKAIFSAPEISTAQCLKDEYKFSQGFINSFFKPFYSGIFLEKELKTSRRMFDFVFKMFSTGNATLPEKGIGAISQQLVDIIGVENITFNCEVEKVTDGRIYFSDKNTAEGIVLNTVPELINNEQMRQKPVKFVSAWNFYFEALKSPFKKPYILLNANDNAMITTLAVLTDVQKAYHQNGGTLISVTVIDKEMKSDKAFALDILAELQKVIPVAYKWRYLKSFRIKKALPEQSMVKNHLTIEEIKIGNKLYLAGDFLLNGSLNAAMKSGRLAAEAIISQLQEK